MSSVLCFLSAVLCLLSSLFSAGCATSPSWNRSTGPDRTAGLSLSMEVRRGEGSIARYEVAPDGDIAFFGGKTALFGGDPNWTGPLTDDEINQLQQIVNDYNFFDGVLESSNEPDDLKYTIVLRQSMTTRRIKITGENPAVTPLEDLLAKAAARRNDPVLNSLPKPSIKNLGR